MGFFPHFYIKNLKKNKNKNQKLVKFTLENFFGQISLSKNGKISPGNKNTECNCWFTGQGSPPLPPFQVVNQFIA